MKELSIEVKAKRYDEAIERAKSLIDFCSDSELKTLEYVFHELKESEGERIRKAILWCIRTVEIELGCKDVDGIDVAELKSWLEKQGEQKPAELANGEDYGIDGLWTALDILQKTYGKVEGYQSDDGILEHKAAITAVKKLYEQKPAWSEEDELMISRFNNCIGHYYADNFITKEQQVIMEDWLKSFKERCTWKPSKEQMKALNNINLTGSISYAGQGQVLINLYDELKKLKE